MADAALGGDRPLAADIKRLAGWSLLVGFAPGSRLPPSLSARAQRRLTSLWGAKQSRGRTPSRQDPGRGDGLGEFEGDQQGQGATPGSGPCWSSAHSGRGGRMSPRPSRLVELRSFPPQAAGAKDCSRARDPSSSPIRPAFQADRPRVARRFRRGLPRRIHRRGHGQPALNLG